MTSKAMVVARGGIGPEPVILVDSRAASRQRKASRTRGKQPVYFAAGALASETALLPVFRSIQPLVSVYW